MKAKKRKEQTFHEYFKEWVDLYKVGAIRSITLQKYYVTEQKIQELVPELKIKDLDRYTYQQLLNNYALTHEKQTTMDFHHHLKGAILDAVDEGVLNQNPTRKIVIKGKNPRPKKAKFLNQFEVQVLLKELNLKEDINWDWFILLIIKTGLRFSEALALTPSDFDFSTQKISINKTWDYKMVTGSFQPTKNESSNRKIQIDWQLAMQFSQLIKMKDSDK
ncbi:site-specific integrase, partial [Listeria monocytogenes]|nr:site-specific integrase [Listeria monocytogenes]EAD5333347.1 site-specific integrase [Listeria monocytogenes]HAC1590780.1 tyrosine-type recombinase/integrase [Listeria monocytogenes]